jgi:hypothetical protein
MDLSGTEVVVAESTERAIGGREYNPASEARKALGGLSGRIHIDLKSRSR